MADLTAAEVFRDFSTYGISSSGIHKPKKSDIRALLKQYEAIIFAFTSNGGLVYSSYASLYADLSHDANRMAWVVTDDTPENNGIYKKSGASGSGSWTRMGDLPYSFIMASDEGAGTANAIVATTSTPVSETPLILFNVFRDNDDSPVTIAFNGGSALTIKSNSGEDVEPGGLVAGMVLMGKISGSTFRLTSDETIAARLFAARDVTTAARDKAQEWAEKATDSPVETGQFSAKHHAVKAAASAAAALASENAAAVSQGIAQQAAEDATEIATGQVFATDAESRDPTTAGKVVDPRRVFASLLYRRLDLRLDGLVPNQDAAINAADLNAAIDFCMRNGLIVNMGGRYRITNGPMIVRTHSGRNNAGDAGLFEFGHVEFAKGTRIVQMDDNTPGLILHGRGQRIGDVQVEAQNFQTADKSNANGIVFKDWSFGHAGYLDSRNFRVGVSQDFFSGDNDQFFDNHIEALRVLGVSQTGIIIRPLNEGNTPCVIGMMSVLAPWRAGASDKQIQRSSSVTTWQQGIDAGIILRGSRGLKVNKINVESLAASRALIACDNARETDIGTIHFEAVGLSQSEAAFTEFLNSYVNIGGISLYDFDMGFAFGLTGSTSVFEVLQKGFFNVNVLEMSGRFWMSGTQRMAVGQEPGHRIGKFVDDAITHINSDSATSTGTIFVDGSRRPRTLYTGSGVAMPVVTHFDGLPIAPSFWARPSGSTVRSTTGAIPIVEVHDTCACYEPSTGVFTAPVAGKYKITARGRANAGADAVFVIRRNGSDALARWRHLRSTGADVFTRDNYPPVTVDFYLSAGDTITMELESGEMVLDNTVFFTADFVSR